MLSKLLHTFPQNPPEYILERAEGSSLIFKNQMKIYDLTGGQTSHCTIGWGNESVIKAIQNQASQFCHADYKAFIDENRESLAEILLAENTIGLEKVYFSGNSGGEACEAAMKLSYQAHLLNGQRRTQFISRRESYHGSSTDTMSLGDRPNLAIYTPIFPQNKIYVSEQNKYRNSGLNETDDEYLIRSIAEIEQTIVANNPNNICAFIGESITGGLSGYVPPVKRYWSEVKRVLDKYGIHLILDEVITGTGTSGKYFCAEYDSVEPDFLFIGKTLTSGYVPLSCVLLGKKISDLLCSSNRIQHSTTHQGHSLGVAAALAVQKICKDSSNLAYVREVGEELRNRLVKNLSSSKFFKNVRGRGFRFAVEYGCKDNDTFGRLVTKRLFDQHQILVDGKWHRFTFSPMINEERQILIEVLDKFSDVFLKTEIEFDAINSTSKLSTSDPQARAF